MWPTALERQDTGPQNGRLRVWIGVRAVGEASAATPIPRALVASRCGRARGRLTLSPPVVPTRRSNPPFQPALREEVIVMRHLIVTAQLGMDVGSDTEAHRRVQAALEALGKPSLVAVAGVDEVNEAAANPAAADHPAEGFYRTVFQVEVLSCGLFDPGGGREDLNDLEAIAYAITEGDCSGEVREVSCDRVTREQMRALLIAQRSDPEFLLGDDDAFSQAPAASSASSASSSVSTRTRNLDLLARLGVTELGRIQPKAQVALLVVALPADADTPLMAVDSAHASRDQALAQIWPDGTNPLPSLLVDLSDDDAILERIDYHPVTGIAVGDERLQLSQATADGIIDLVGLLDD